MSIQRPLGYKLVDGYPVRLLDFPFRELTKEDFEEMNKLDKIFNDVVEEEEAEYLNLYRYDSKQKAYILEGKKGKVIRVLVEVNEDDVKEYFNNL
jgi:hypothetical protein